uniref:Uncharacterized protein n=1 Tax=Timema poppense TaxID=170557 RepID=A0A7R9DQ25_TIMPO|nr:unnamed protein product [Timema poppensis]
MVSSLPVWAHVSMDIAVVWLSFMLGTELPTYLKNILHYNTTSSGHSDTASRTTNMFVFLFCSLFCSSLDTLLQRAEQRICSCSCSVRCSVLVWTLCYSEPNNEYVGLISALPSISSWLSHLFFGIFSQWIRRKGYVGHLTAYRIFNAIATIGPAAAILVITQIGCDAPTIIALLAITTFCSGAFVGGSMLNYMDLAINFVPALSGFSATATGIIGIMSPTITSYIINNQVSNGHF